MSKGKRRAAREAENALVAQAFVNHTPQTQLKIAKNRDKTRYKSTLTKLKRLISDQSDPIEVNDMLLTLTQHHHSYTDAIHALIDVTENDKVDNLLTEADIATNELETLQARLIDDAASPTGSVSHNSNLDDGSSHVSDVTHTLTTKTPAKESCPVDMRPLSHAAPEFRPPRAVIASHLTRIKIPSFSGDKMQYHEWRSVFDHCVDADVTSAEMKLLYLRNSLEGDALRSINGLGYSAHAYEAAKEILEREYGGARRLSAIRMEELERFRPMKEPSGKEIKGFASLLNLLVTNLREEGKNAELDASSTLYQQALKKLPERLIVEYKRWVETRQQRESVEILRNWISLESKYWVEAEEAVKGIGGDSTPTGGPRRNRTNSKTGSAGRAYHNNSGESSENCPACEGSHKLWRCENFRKLKVAERQELVGKKHLCFRCLNRGHVARDCTRKMVCGIDECQRMHSRFLHPRTSHEGEQTSATIEKNSFTGTTVDAQEEPVISLRTIPVVLKSRTQNITVNAMLDDGATRSYINSDVAATLGVLTGCGTSISVCTLGGKTQTFQSEEVHLKIQSCDGSYSAPLVVSTSHNVTGTLEPVDWKTMGKGWKHLRSVRFPTLAPTKKVDLIIGVDNLELMRSDKELHGEAGQPIARLTPLGWTCIGPTAGRKSRLQHAHSAFHIMPNARLERNVERFWEMEDFPESSVEPITGEDKEALDLVSRSIRRSDDAVRYQVGMPWKRDPTEIKPNLELARKRLISTENSLRKKGVYEAYKAVLDNHLVKEYTRVVSTDTAAGKWYLPHFAVLKPDRATTKCRIVFDASAGQESCLNDFIHKGPKLQRDLKEVLVRFRKNPVAIACDVSEMYMQVEIAPGDRPYHRFLWRDDNGREQQYEFNRLVFGVNSSPFQAQFVVRHHAEQNRETHPRAAEAVLESTYMDDTMDSVGSEAEGIELYHQLSELWLTAGMKARKWISNSKRVLEEVPVSDQVTEIDMIDCDLPEIKTLGVLWKAEEDIFTFHHSVAQDQKVCTKRSLLSSIALLFDPLGMLAPFTIRGKMLLQEIWMLGADWDDELPPELSGRIEEWYSQLQLVGKISIPRGLRDGNQVSDVALHFFSDASEYAYATVGYVVCMYENGGVTSRQVVSKAKVAPLKTISIPRLELMGALLSVKVALVIAKGLAISPTEVHYWSDSMNVLWWIHRRSRIFKTFVANRVAKIQQDSNISLWRHVPTENNPADVGSRGCGIEDLAKNELWSNGPKFLPDSSSWPVKDFSTKQPCDSEVKLSANLTYYTKSTVNVAGSRLDPTRYSSWTRLLRIAAWISRFSNNCRTDEKVSGDLTLDETLDSENMLIRSAQQIEFGEERKQLLRGRTVDKNSKIISLNPFLDDDGLIRSNSRLVNAGILDYDTKHPILLPRKSWTTTIIVRFYHQRGGHACGTNHTLSEVSQRFWIPHAREAIREVERTCNQCAYTRAKAANQQMAPLPSCRLGAPHRAFLRISVDYAGPFEVIMGRGRKRAKRYLCLFTCLLSRAVHLEMAFSMDTDSFLHAFFRMVNRRGVPSVVYSDNGTNFVAGERELREVVEQLDEQRITEEAVKRRIKWRFNPPAAPHFGGVHEALVKTSKRAIYAILRGADINDEELMTSFSGAEEIVNSRPITYQTSNPADDLPLTPNNFLTGRNSMEFPYEVLDESTFSMRIRWRRVQELNRHFWTRWVREWLPALAQRRKWTEQRENLKEGDLVLVMEVNTIRGRWPLARIIETYKGKDGLIRSVKIKMKGKTFVRPIVKLYPLELSDSEDPHSPGTENPNLRK